MNPERLISVVIPTHNRAGVLPEAIDSVVGQSFSDFELVIIDDGSTDDTPRVVDAIGDPRLVYHRTSNQGVCAARNEGARRAGGRWVTFLDSDDLALPGWLESFAAMANGQPEPGIVFCGCRRTAAVGSPPPEPFRPTSHPFERRVPHLFLTGTFAVQRLPFLEAGGYDETIRYAENSELRMRLLPWLLERGWPSRSTDEPLVEWRATAGGSPARHPIASRLRASELILERHGALLKQRFPRGYANSSATAGICHARLGNWRMARRRLLAAVVTCPRRTRNAARLLLTLFPPLGTLVWDRVPSDDDHS